MTETLFQKSVTFLEKLTPYRNLAQRVPAIRHILSGKLNYMHVCLCVYIYIYMGSYNETTIKGAGWSRLKVEFCFPSNIQTHSVIWKLLGQVQDWDSS